MEIINAFALIINYIIIPGLTYGCQLALGALGVTIIYTVLRFSNFAHGELMSFGAMTSILITWIISYFGISIFPLPTVILALPISILITISYCLLIDKYCFQYHREKNSKNVISLIVSIGVMFFTSGLIRVLIGPNDRTINDGERFIISAREFKEITGLTEGISLKLSQKEKINNLGLFIVGDIPKEYINKIVENLNLENQFKIVIAKDLLEIQKLNTNLILLSPGAITRTELKNLKQG